MVEPFKTEMRRNQSNWPGILLFLATLMSVACFIHRSDNKVEAYYVVALILVVVGPFWAAGAFLSMRRKGNIPFRRAVFLSVVVWCLAAIALSWVEMAKFHAREAAVENLRKMRETAQPR